ncbi:hypothetical protein JCM11641_004499 [Rhodosporidiobolus odoratus]
MLTNPVYCFNWLTYSPQHADQAKAEADYELFLRDIEEDNELRQTVQLFKDQASAEQQAHAMAEDTDAEAEEDFPEINVDDLLDDMEGLQIEEGEQMWAGF